MRVSTLAEYLERHREWSTRTFGPGLKTLGVTRHIEKEIAEVRQNPHDLSEWVDIIILALDGYWRHGGTPDTIMRDLAAKQDKNFARQWPWPAPTSDNQPVEHIKRTCNRHFDCDKANAEWLARHPSKAIWDLPADLHCHAEDCEDCFGQ